MEADLAADNPSKQPIAPRKRGRSSKVTQSMILSAAREEFAENGYDATTTASIARRVGVTQPLVHYHFGSKEILWKTTINELFDRLQARLAAKSAEFEGVGPMSRLAGIGHALVDFTIEAPELSRIINHDGVIEGSRLEWLVDEHVRPLAELWQKEIEAARETGQIKDIPVPFLSFIFLGAAQYFFNLSPLVNQLFGLEPHSPDTAKDYANALVEVFLKGCGRSNDAC